MGRDPRERGTDDRRCTVFDAGLKPPPRRLKLLFLASRFPHPPLRGDQVRAYHQLRLLGLHHDVTLVCFSEETTTIRDQAAIRGFCKEIIAVPVSPLDGVKGMLRAAFRGLPFQVGLYDSSAMRRRLSSLLADGRYDLVHVQLARMAPLLPPGTAPVLVDLVDALSLNRTRRGGFDPTPAGWVAWVEHTRLRRYEERLCRTHDRLTVVSEADRRFIGSFSSLVVNANGVDLERFSPGGEPRDRRKIVLTGNLGSFPNADAALWFARAVLPLVRRQRPDVHWIAAGARPSRELVRLGRDDSRVTVTGVVPDLRTYLVKSCLAVAPLRSGSGQSTKVLEAMASCTPLVATTRTLGGLAVEGERHLLVADTAEDFARQVLRLLEDPDLAGRLAREARAYVEQNHRWERSVGELQELYFSMVNPDKKTAGVSG